MVANWWSPNMRSKSDILPNLWCMWYPDRSVQSFSLILFLFFLLIYPALKSYKIESNNFISEPKREIRLIQNLRPKLNKFTAWNRICFVSSVPKMESDCVIAEKCDNYDSNGENQFPPREPIFDRREWVNWCQLGVMLKWVARRARMLSWCQKNREKN